AFHAASKALGSPYGLAVINLPRPARSLRPIGKARQGRLYGRPREVIPMGRVRHRQIDAIAPNVLPMRPFGRKFGLEPQQIINDAHQKPISCVRRTFLPKFGSPSGDVMMVAARPCCWREISASAARRRRASSSDLDGTGGGSGTLGVEKHIVQPPAAILIASFIANPLSETPTVRTSHRRRRNSASPPLSGPVRLQASDAPDRAP